MIDLSNFSVKAVRSILFCFNLFFVITGLVLISIGVMVKSYLTQYEEFLDDRYFSASSLLIASGSIVFFIAFFGCCGAIRESRWMTLSYSLFLSGIIILEFASGVTGYVLAGETGALLNGKLNETMYEYGGKNVGITKLWDMVQTQFECCGLNKAEDWAHVFLNDSLPMSCCSPPPYGTLNYYNCTLHSQNLFKKSCEGKLVDEVSEHTYLLGGVAFAVIGAQFLGILFSCYLAKAIKNSNYESV